MDRESMTMVYEINGRRYTFADVHHESGYLRGYCKMRKKWGWLFDNYIQLDGEDITFATRISVP